MSFIRSIRALSLSGILMMLFVLQVGTLPLRAQSTYTGQLSGAVTDSSGAVIPGAKVTLTIPNSGAGGSNFGQVTGTLGGPRTTQFGVRFEF